MTEKTIFLIIGLPASGKTTLLKKVKRGVIVDDINDLEQLPDSTNKRIFFSDPYFCDPKTFEKAIKTLQTNYPEHRLLTIYFENHRDKALINAQKRQRQTSGLINQLSKVYKPPF